MPSVPERNSQLLKLKDRIVAHFSQSNWQELGLMTNCDDVVENDPRLLRSLRFGDDDYEGCVISVIRKMVESNPNNVKTIERYLDDRFEEEGEYVSSAPSEKKILFAPNVFKVPEDNLSLDTIMSMQRSRELVRLQASDVCEQTTSGKTPRSSRIFSR